MDIRPHRVSDKVFGASIDCTVFLIDLDVEFICLKVNTEYPYSESSVETKEYLWIKN